MSSSSRFCCDCDLWCRRAGDRMGVRQFRDNAGATKNEVQTLPNERSEGCAVQQPMEWHLQLCRCFDEYLHHQTRALSEREGARHPLSEFSFAAQKAQVAKRCGQTLRKQRRRMLYFHGACKKMTRAGPTPERLAWGGVAWRACKCCGLTHSDWVERECGLQQRLLVSLRCCNHVNDPSASWAREETAAFQSLTFLGVSGGVARGINQI
jgi:hypothetical protein